MPWPFTTILKVNTIKKNRSNFPYLCTTGHSVRQCNRNDKVQFFDSEKF